MIKYARCMAVLVLAMSAAVARADLVVDAGYVRASLPGTATTSAYLTLRNTGAGDVVVTSVTTPLAAKVSFHSTMNHDGMMHMMDMEALKIAAHQSLVLEPGGMHLMLENTAAMLAAGSKVELVLLLADGQKKTITLPVQSVLGDKQ